ncbi:LOB domain-containing protein 38 [Striga hermonthica]|uniref:LOB domain-containing protein 38 n=1 Tax=Striga hermonthica TaxID=68872 RepID=A0A9N7NVS9_STRHE|nr:LOB domain-containing protein 38 [Striga hermonthica]
MFKPVVSRTVVNRYGRRPVNMVSGSVDILWTANWRVCQAAVEAVLRGGRSKSMLNLIGGRLTTPQTAWRSMGGCADWRQWPD